MKTAIKTIFFAFLPFVLLFFACSSPAGDTGFDSEGETKITISLGSQALSKAGFAGDSIANWGDITFVLELTPVSSGKIIKAPSYTSTATSATAQATVTSGFWDITLKAYWPTSASSDLYAEGSVLNAEIKPNVNTNIPIEMDRPGGPFTVNFDLNGGTGTIPPLTNKGLLPDATGMNAGLPFFYWTRNAGGGGTTFSANTSYAPDGVYNTLYAQWTKDVSISVTSPTGTLTPIVSSLAAYPAHDERSESFNVTIPELATSETVTVALATNTYGLSLTGATTVTGPLSQSLTLTYDGMTTVAQTTPVSVGLTVSTTGYNLTGTPSVSATIIDGKVDTRAIPLDSDNIKYFNIFTTESSTMTTGLPLHYKLTEDIVATDLRTAAGDLATGNNWVAIGDNFTRFNGSFDGDNHTITGLKIDVASYIQGMFGSIEINGTDTTTGVLKNIGLINSSISGDQSVGNVVGMIVSGGIVENCYATGNISGNTANMVGGVAGQNWGTVQNCYATGNIDSTNLVGGVVGLNFGIIKNCYTTGDVSGDTNIGGITGGNPGTVQYCYTTGQISGSNQIGGIAGNNSNMVEYCRALNKTITNTGSGTAFGRVAGADTGSLYNQGRDNMTVDGATVSGTWTDINGGDVNSTGWDTAVMWSGTMNFDPAVWDLSGVGAVNLPILRDMPAGTQNPQVIP